ncbi:hypothetical protein ACQY0O_002310 [Thecaphora frezii]
MSVRDAFASSEAAAHPTSGPDAYESLDVIGNGSFGIIRQVRRKVDGQLFARKELKFERMSERDKKQIVAEVNILRQLKHENIVQYVERSIDSDAGILYIVMEYCSGGDLLKIINHHRRVCSRIPEETIWSYIAQLVVALDACHYHGDFTVASIANDDRTDWNSIAVDHNQGRAILHRDLKPENIFLDGHGRIKLGDFGLSKQTPASGFAFTYVGTPYYMSPEVVDGRCYDASSDIWALGCIVYELCTFAPPFDAVNVDELRNKICGGRVPSVASRGYSDDLDDLIGMLLTVDPRSRPTTRRLLGIYNVRNACRALYLEDQLDALEERWKQVEARGDELLEREEQLNKMLRENLMRPSSIELQAKLKEHEARLQELEQREQRVQQMEHEVLKKQKSVDAQRQMCSDEWDKWYGGEKGRVLEENQTLSSKVAELEAQVRQLQLLTADRREASAAPRAAARHAEAHAERKAGLPRADSLTGNLAAAGVRHPPVASAARHAVRPTARRTASGGKTRLSLDGDVSMASIREKVLAGATGLGTPHAIRQRALQARTQTEQQNADGATTGADRASTRQSRASSQGSDEWVDQEANGERRQSPHKPSTSAPSHEAPHAIRRQPSHTRTSRRQTIATETLNNGAEDVDGRYRYYYDDDDDDDDDEEEEEADNGCDDNDDIRGGARVGASARQEERSPTSRTRAARRAATETRANVEAQSYAQQEEQRMFEAIATRCNSVSLEAQAGSSRSQPSSSNASSSSSTSSTTLACSSSAAATRRSVKAVTAPVLGNDPQWLQYDEDDRPSPFIKRMVRMPEKAIGRTATNGAGGQGGRPNLLMKATRAAAAAAAAAAVAAASADVEEYEGHGASPRKPASDIIEEDATMISLSRIEAPLAVRSAPPPPSVISTPVRPRHAAPSTAPIAQPRLGIDKENTRSRPPPTTSTATATTTHATSKPTRRLSHVASSSSLTGAAAQPPLVSDVANLAPQRVEAKPRQPRTSTANPTLGTAPAAPRRARSSLLSGITVLPLNTQQTTQADPSRRERRTAERLRDRTKVGSTA